MKITNVRPEVPPVTEIIISFTPAQFTLLQRLMGRAQNDLSKYDYNNWGFRDRGDDRMDERSLCSQLLNHDPNAL